MKKLILLLPAIALYNSVPAQSTKFEGVITYSMTIEGNTQYAAMMQGSTMKVYVKNNMSKTVVTNPMSNTIVIEDNTKPDEPVILIDAMDNKYQLKNEKNQKDSPQPDFKYDDATKQIAGYLCHHAQLTQTGKGGETMTSDIYYTDQLPMNDQGGKLKGLKGFPLEFNGKVHGITSENIATSVEKQPLSDTTFIVPKGYKLVTRAEMMEEMKGGH
jgi:GLPGLI family protein